MQVAFERPDPTQTLLQPSPARVIYKVDSFRSTFRELWRDTRDELFRSHRLIMFVITDKRLSNLEMSQQISGMSRVLGRDYVRGFQRLEGAQSNVVKIADRRGDDIKHI